MAPMGAPIRCRSHVPCRNLQTVRFTDDQQAILTASSNETEYSMYIGIGTLLLIIILIIIFT